MDAESEVISGRVAHITYRSQETGYTVFTVAANGEDIVAVGNFPYISLGDVITLTGRFTVHPTYGPQFRAETCTRETPSTEAAILRYLSSGAVKGIGPSTAAKMLRKFGSETLEILRNDPARLSEIRGISLEKAKKMSEEYNQQSGLQELMIFLSKYKVSPESSARIYKVLGQRSIDIISNNPYSLCCEDIGFPFYRADEMAETLDIPPDSENRIFAGIEYIMRHNLMNGHTCLPRLKVTEIASRMLGCSEDDASSAIDKMTVALRLRSYPMNDTEFLFLPAYFAAEEYIAARLYVLLKYAKPDYLDAMEIDYVEGKLHIKYDSRQREAIATAFERGMLILTGGPGTGKTTTLNGLIELFEGRELRVLLAAPTGRAAKRMTELTGREAKTLHRLLEVQWGEGDKPYFDRNERNPLSCDVVIVDEMSMVDVVLFESLLRAIKIGTRIILVGDSDQLPSVSAGNVLHDIISFDAIPCVRLEKIFRQSEKSLIIRNAHDIISGRMPELNSHKSDFFMIDCTSAAETASVVAELCSKRLPDAYGFSPLNDIQVLCPSRKLDLGTVALNTLLQNCINPPEESRPYLSYGGFTYRPNDKVMQIKNNYDISWIKDDGEQGSGCYNGDIGVIETIDTGNQIMTVRFDDRVATYYSTELSMLEPAYAVTVHKSQGSEFNSVIIPLYAVPPQLLYRNLLYTAVTRAKRLLVIVGDRRLVGKMIENDRKMLRYSGLNNFLKDNFNV